MSLADKKCVPCEGGTPPLTIKEVAGLLKSVDSNWKSLGNQQLDREFKFKNFIEAVGFLNKVALVSEKEGHHPNLCLHDWNQVKITLSTHAIGGLSENDFILAAKVDRLL